MEEQNLPQSIPQPQPVVLAVPAVKPKRHWVIGLIVGILISVMFLIFFIYIGNIPVFKDFVDNIREMIYWPIKELLKYSYNSSFSKTVGIIFNLFGIWPLFGFIIGFFSTTLKRTLILLGVFIVILGTSMTYGYFSYIYEWPCPLSGDLSNYEEHERERSLVGSPGFISGPAICINNQDISALMLIIETSKELTEVETLDIENEIGGTFCGGSANSDTYYFCLSPIAKTEDQLMAAIKRGEQFDIITGIGPYSIHLSVMNEG